MSVFKVIWQFKSNVVQSLSCFWLFVTPMESSTPGFPVLQCLLEFAQIHVHWVMDAIQASHPLLLRSPPVLSLSQHQGLFQWVGSSHQVTKVSELQLQHQSFQWIFRVDFFFFFLELTGLIFLQSKGLLRAFPSTTVQKHQFFDAQPSLWSNSKWQPIQYSCLENPMDRGAW